MASSAIDDKGPSPEPKTMQTDGISFPAKTPLIYSAAPSTVLINSEILVIMETLYIILPYFHREKTGYLSSRKIPRMTFNQLVITWPCRSNPCTSCLNRKDTDRFFRPWKNHALREPEAGCCLLYPGWALKRTGELQQKHLRGSP